MKTKNDSKLFLVYQYTGNSNWNLKKNCSSYKQTSRIPKQLKFRVANGEFLKWQRELQCARKLAKPKNDTLIWRIDAEAAASCTQVLSCTTCTKNNPPVSQTIIYENPAANNSLPPKMAYPTDRYLVNLLQKKVNGLPIYYILPLYWSAFSKSNNLEIGHRIIWGHLNFNFQSFHFGRIEIDV